jgi:hypothetical protein
VEEVRVRVLGEGSAGRGEKMGRRLREVLLQRLL